MKSICIKTNNKYIIDYLLKDFSNIDLDNIYLSNNSFKNYDNVIIHYSGNEMTSFFENICDILTQCIFFFCEENIVKKLIKYNYFYFDDTEKKQILQTTMEELNLDSTLYREKYKLVFNSIEGYLKENHAIVLSGFVNFRIKDYITMLDEITDLSVSNFLIEREYFEFINMLRMYINSKPSTINHVHLIYINNEASLIDNDKNLIPIDENVFNAKYLSDISFSSNDFCLNTLLTLIPQKLTIHLINSFEDEFINTLKLIFENRVSVCTECDICRVYSVTHNCNT